MSDSLRPHELNHARPPCPSSTPGVYLNSRPLSRWCHPAISSSIIPFFSCPQSLPTSGSFPTPQFKSINSSTLSFLYSPTLTSIHGHWKTIALAFYIKLPFFAQCFAHSKQIIYLISISNNTRIFQSSMPLNFSLLRLKILFLCNTIPVRLIGTDLQIEL